MDTNTRARLELILPLLTDASKGYQVKANVDEAWSKLQETITGDYDYVGQPMKNTKAFESKIGICYIPEASDQAYTYFDIAAITGDNHETTERVFQLCEWQHPETVFEEGVREGEWTERGEILIK